MQREIRAFAKYSSSWRCQGTGDFSIDRRANGPQRMQALSDRQNTIVTLALSIGRVTVEDLAARFEVTPQTIRRDLNELCDLRVLSRTHGGAIIASSVENLSYEARRFIAATEKREIGIAAAALIPNECSLFINIGTTTEEVATALKHHQNLLIITNNLNVAMALYRFPTIEVIVAGGPVRRSDGAVIGSSAVDLIKQFKVDMAVIGASALDEDGSLLDYDPARGQCFAGHYRQCTARSSRVRPNKTRSGCSGPHRSYVGNPCFRDRPADLRPASRSLRDTPRPGNRSRKRTFSLQPFAVCGFRELTIRDKRNARRRAD